MDREAWHTAVLGVAKSRTCLSNLTELFSRCRISTFNKIQHQKNAQKNKKGEENVHKNTYKIPTANIILGFPGDSMVKNQPVMQEM